MILDILGYLIPGGPYFEKRKARLLATKLQGGQEVLFEAARLPNTGNAISGYVRICLPRAWWRPNREASAGEIVLCENFCRIDVRPVDKEAFKRGAPKYWVIAEIHDARRTSTLSVSEANGSVLRMLTVQRA